MATLDSLAGTVRNAITSGTASPSTVTTLQTLLSSGPRIGSQLDPASHNASKAVATSRSTKAIKSQRPAGKAVKKEQEFQIHEDSSRTLPPRARYALATEIVNIGLKVLSEATTNASIPRSEEPSESKSSGNATPQRHSRASSLSQRALQLRSGSTTPHRRSPTKSPVLSRTSSRTSIGNASAITVHLTAVAECTRLGLSTLGSMDASKLNVKPLPKLQLEKGILSLVGMLLVLRLDATAVKGLRSLKRRLESLQIVSGKKHPTGAFGTETLGSLLHLELDFGAHPEAISLAITYQLHVLRVITNTRKPATIEDASQYLMLTARGSPAELMLLSAKTVGNQTKIVKQLEAFAQTVLKLCPSVSGSADDLAQDSNRSPCPVVVFQLQTLALQVRQEAWRISKNPVDLQSELSDPFARCMSTLVRRSPLRKQAATIFKICTTAHEVLGLAADSSQGTRDLAISRTFALLAAEAGEPGQAFAWAEVAVKETKVLDKTHARHLAAVGLRLSLALRAPYTLNNLDDVASDIRHLLQGIRGRPSGSRSDHEQLIAELSRLTSVHSDWIENIETHEAWKELVRSAGGFAPRIAGLFPGTGSQTTLNIVNTALLYSNSSDELLSWVSKDCAQLFQHAGVLGTVAESASAMPMAQAWSSSSKAIALSRILRALVTKAATIESQKHAALIFDDDGLVPEESGALLEWQLNCALNMAHRAKYQKAIQTIVSYIFGKLLIRYSATDHPVRRCRIACLAMRAREQFPEVLPPHCLQPFLEIPLIDINTLAKDIGLQSYVADINASLGISRAFHGSPVIFSKLATHLQTWQHLIETSAQSDSFARVVDSPVNLLSQLSALEEYAGVMGHDVERLRVVNMLSRASEICDVRSGDRCCYSLRTALAYLTLGLAEKAETALGKALQSADQDGDSDTAILDYYLCKAEQLLALDKVVDCQDMLDKAHETRLHLAPHKIKSHQSKSYKLLHGRGWLLQSQCWLAAGSAHESLRAAKRSARVFNSIWSAIERAAAQGPYPDTSETETRPEESSMEDLSKKVSKLNLKPGNRDSKTSAKPEVRGAAFWPVVRLLCRALMHLSDVYVHHGVFIEANHSSEQAMRIAESIQSEALLSRVRSHRSTLLTAAGRVEEAELCLAQDTSDASQNPSLAVVERLGAKCALAVKTCELEDALKYTHEAIAVMQATQAANCVAESDRVVARGDAVLGKPSIRAPTETSSRSVAIKQPPRPRAAPKTTRAVVFNKTGKKAAPAARAQGYGGNFYILRKLEAQLIVRAATISLKLNRLDDDLLARLNNALDVFPASFARHQLDHLLAMHEVTTNLESDFAYNALPESTLSFPALKTVDLSIGSLATKTNKPATKSKRSAKSVKPTSSSQGSLETLLLAAQQSLMLDGPAERLLATSDVHRQHSMLSNTAMLLSATSTGHEASTANQIREALVVDYPRMHAAECQAAFAELEEEAFQASDLLDWPISKTDMSESGVIMDRFQEDYVDILPAPWTAVSIGLNQDCDELYITRYRRGKSPLVLRLPFSRQKSEDNEEEIFDFHACREELKEIIELSNYSCHNLDAGAKGAKSNWWSEREALDLRLHELLMNIENIWLGGFRGALSQQPTDSDQLSRFRKDFEVVLDRHLPSRRATKRGSQKLSLDDQILELFIGLGSDKDGEVDLDEPLSDLLYFVVDMLQFSGERNAYDEVDFDSMTIEVLDALRSYHDSVDVEDLEGAHLILVLDRRLQAFPWESLPCLQNSGISRVDSMLSLRDRIVEMSRRSGVGSDRYTVARQSGGYILNPSADLKNTEASLAPELLKLAQADGAEWKAIVGQAPTEKEFSDVLTTSSTLLYFGHGAGSQYIRPRAIRRLEKCSEVVWLMGCSSGAVTEHDELEPFAVPLAYMVAGQHNNTDDQSSTRCMSVLATLWDVTDKDIDRFSLAVGEEWGLWGSQEVSCNAPAKTPRKRQAVAAPTTPQRGAKTPKTPKVRKTPAPARTPVRSQSRARDVGKKQSLVQAVAKSRDACYLRYLNGAAPVVYGVPVYLGQ